MISVTMVDSKPKVSIDFPSDVDVRDFAAILFFLNNGGLMNDFSKAILRHGAETGTENVAAAILEQYDVVADTFIEEFVERDNDMYSPRNTMANLINHSKDVMEG